MATADETLGFRRELRELRQEKGLPIYRLAAAAGLSSSYVSDLELGKRGSRPSSETIERLARALEVDPDRFRLYRARQVLALWPQAIDRVYDELVKRRNGGPS